MGQQTDTIDQQIKCPKCGAISGDSWSQCEGVCPMPSSPHYHLATAEQYAGGYVEVVTVPKQLLTEVLEQAEADNRSTEGEFACSSSDDASYVEEREKINQLRRIAGIEIVYPDDEIAVTGPLGPTVTNGDFAAGEPINKGSAVRFDKESGTWLNTPNEEA